MAAQFQTWIYDRWGARLAVIDTLTKLTSTRTVNAVGSLVLTMPRDAVSDEQIKPDNRIEVWRKPDGGTWTIEGGTAWLIQSDVRGQLARDGRYRTIKAKSATHLLARRCVLYYADSAQAQKTAPADNLMKAIVRENLGTSANGSPFYSSAIGSRDLSAYLSVQADVSAGPSVTKGFAWRNVLAVLQDIANDAARADATKKTFFDVVWTGAILEFRTYVGQRGLDRMGLVVSTERGSLGETVELTADWADSASVVVTGGQGDKASRLTGSAYDAMAIGKSPFGLREAFSDATALTDAGSLNAEASAELRRRRATKTLLGSLLSVPGAAYGIDWGFGDKLTAEFEGDSFSATVDAVTITVEKGVEQIAAKLTAEAPA